MKKIALLIAGLLLATSVFAVYTVERDYNGKVTQNTVTIGKNTTTTINLLTTHYKMSVYNDSFSVLYIGGPTVTSVNGIPIYPSGNFTIKGDALIHGWMSSTNDIKSFELYE